MRLAAAGLLPLRRLAAVQGTLLLSTLLALLSYAWRLAQLALSACPEQGVLEVPAAACLQPQALVLLLVGFWH